MMMINTYPVPADLLQSRIRLEARTAAGKWLPVPVCYAGSIDERSHAKGGTEGWASLSVGGPVELRATFPDPVTSAVVRPTMRDAVAWDIDGRSVQVRIDQPRYVVLEINYPPTPDRWSAVFTLYLLIDEIDADAPDANAGNIRVLVPGHHEPAEFDPGQADTLLLLPGIHTVEGQLVDLHTDKTLYLAGGAYLRSYIRGEGVNGASIRGRGVIDGTGVDRKSIEWRDDGDAGFVFFRRGSDNTIDGPVIFDSPLWNIVTFGTTGTTIRNYKCITWKVNNDGIQPRSCNGMRVEHCFLKCADDCIAVKTRRSAGMSSRDLLFRDLVCWNDQPGNAIEIGHTSQADLLENVRFEDIAVVHSCGGGDGRRFTVSISLIDHCLVRDIHYRNITVEGIRSGDFRFWIGTSEYTTDAERGRIEDINVDGYHVQGAFTNSLLKGADPDHLVRNIRLDNITHSGGITATPADLNLRQEHTQSLRLNGEPMR